MQENCLFGSEGGAKLFFVPTPIRSFQSGRHSYFVPWFLRKTDTPQQPACFAQPGLLPARR